MCGIQESLTTTRHASRSTQLVFDSPANGCKDWCGGGGGIIFLWCVGVLATARAGATRTIIWETPSDNGVAMDALIVPPLDEGVGGAVTNYG